MRPLNFFHITKNGGTTLTDIAHSKNVLWSWRNKVNLNANRNKSLGLSGPLWHQLPRAFKQSYYEQYDWFCVVRDPLDRCLSEYHCNWDGFGRKSILTKHSQKEFNEYVVKRVNERMKTCHWHPMFEYLFRKNGERLVQHIVRFDHMREDFNALANSYGLGFELPETAHSNKRGRTLFTKEDLFDETRDLIENAYAMDFTLYRQLERHRPSISHGADHTTGNSGEGS